ncbi:MAG: hypothetical protein AAB646_00660 [Patescibacteria group bacterium]
MRNNFQFSIFNFSRHHFLDFLGAGPRLWRWQFAIILFVIWILSFGFSGAQVAPEFMVTWKANSYAPAGYQGKILPIANTPIEVSFELIDGGKLADLSRNEIRWYLNGNFEKSGKGLKSLSFSADGLNGNNQQVRITVMNYKGTELDEIVDIPMAVPEVVIDAPYPDNQVGIGENFLTALLYFFNLDNASQGAINWSANGADSQGLANNPEILNLDTKDLDSNTPINLQASARNLLNPFEIAVKIINLATK